MLRSISLFILALAAFAVMGVSPALAEIEPTDANGALLQSPAVLMKHWQDSSSDTKTAFLLGFVGMLEVERAWQKNTSLTPEKSLIQAWSYGLQGVTFNEMQKALDSYCVANPEQLEKPVIEVLWAQLVQPKLPEDMKKQISKASYAKDIKR